MTQNLREFKKAAVTVDVGDVVDDGLEVFVRGVVPVALLERSEIWPARGRRGGADGSGGGGQEGVVCTNGDRACVCVRVLDHFPEHLHEQHRHIRIVFTSFKNKIIVRLEAEQILLLY